MYEDKTYESIKDNILKDIPQIDKREGSFVNDMVSPVALEFEGAYAEFKKMLGTMFLDDAASEYLEKRAKEYGIVRKTGTNATGKVEFLGVEGTIIPMGSLVSTFTGLLYETIEENTIVSGKVEIEVKAQEIGSKYNVIANTITQIPVSIIGISGCNNKEEFKGGTDIEKDEDLLTRTLLKIQNPATSGNKMHYKLWALEVAGVGDAKVFPLWNGNGTVRVIPITAEKRSPNELILQAVRDNIESQRPIGSTITVEAPQEVIINVEAAINIDPTFSKENIKAAYELEFKNYIKSSVFKLSNVDYFKCLSLFYEIEGVIEVTSFKLNNGNTNINISSTQIQVAGTITVS